MRYLLDVYKQMIENGQIDAIKIDVYKRINEPQPPQDDKELNIPKFEYITGCVYTVEMVDFQDNAIEALDHLNYFQIDNFEFKQHNMNEIATPVLQVTIIIRSDDNEI